MSSLLNFLTPYEFSPLVLVACAGSVALYFIGLRRMRSVGEAVNGWRTASFLIGVGSIYAVMQTHIDYYSQHMFWIHRAQHLVLHHVGAFLVVLAVPQPIIARALPAPLMNKVLVPLWRHPLVRIPYRTVQYPAVAAILFVGLIFFWLTPSIHFAAMLSASRYELMNLSMVVDGLLFWWLVVDPRPKEQGGMGYGARIIMVWAIMFPQIVLGAYISLSSGILYDVYSICGRAWPLSPIVDQQVGGLITWIPSSMMSVVGMLLVLRMWRRDNARASDAQSAAVAAAS